MITLIKYGALGGGEKYNANIMYIDGLSTTDTKPTGTFEGMPIPNASVYTEIDTGKQYRYDAAGATWYQSTAGGGGGGGGVSDYDALSNRPQVNSTTLTGNLSSSDLGLQGALTETQMAAVDSGITSTDVSQINTNKTNISKQQDTVASGGNGYALINGIRVYVSATAPTGDIPDGSVGVGW